MSRGSSESGISVESSNTSLPEDFASDHEHRPRSVPRPTPFRSLINYRLRHVRSNRQYKRTQPLFCGKHNQRIRFYCNDCRVKVCKMCILLDHGFCDTEVYKTIATKLRESTVQNDFDKINAIRMNSVNAKKFFDSKFYEIINNIDLMTHNLIKEIEEHRHKLRGKLPSVQSARYNSWFFQMELCEISLKKLQSYKKRLRHVDFMGDVDTDHTEISDNELDASDIPVSPENSTIILPEISYSNRYNACTIYIRNTMNEAPIGNYFVTAAIQDPDENSLYLTLENEKNGKYKLSYYPTRSGVHRLYVYLQSTLIGNPLDVDVCREESELTPRRCSIINEFGEVNMMKPWGICADYRGRLLVVDRGNDCVKIFTENGTFLKSFGKTGSGPGEFNRPTGIAVDHNLERIIVVDKDNHRIQVFSLNGIFLLEFGSKGEENGQFYYPWDVSVSDGSLIAISDTNNQRIQLFDQRGGFIRQFSFKFDGMPDIEMPRGLAFRRDGSLMVTDFNKHRVVLLNDSFQSARTFGTEGSLLAQFYRPQGIDIDRCGRFAVADCRNERVQVFQPNGKLHCSFGSSGENPKELNTPQGLCFLPNERIAVVELDTGKIKIYEIPQEA